MQLINFYIQTNQRNEIELKKFFKAHLEASGHSTLPETTIPLFTKDKYQTKTQT